MKLFFATTNEGKLNEARQILNVEVEGTPLEIEEIQSLDPGKVAKAKAIDYFNALQKPIFIEDVSLSFTALNGLPGPYISDFYKALGNKGIIQLLDSKEDRSATALTTIVYITKPDELHIFTGEVKGTIATEERGTNGFAWDPIFIPDGETRTFAELETETKNEFSMRKIALEKFSEWLKYSPQLA